VAFTALNAITPAMPHLNVAGGIVDPGDLTTVAAAVVGFVAVLRSGAWRQLRPRRAPEAFALALMVPFTLIAAVHEGTARGLAVGPARWALTAVVVALAYLLIRTRRDGARMIRALVLVALVEAAFGLISYATRYYGPGGFIGISFTGGKIGGMPVWGRITGTTGMASTFIAGYFALTLPAAVSLAMAARSRMRWLWSGASVIIFFGLVFTLSRTPIGLATVAVAVLLLAATRPRVWVPILVAAAVVFLATPLRARMTDFDTDRLKLWRTGWRVFADNWFFGVGPGQYVNRLPAYQQPGKLAEDVTPHNSLLYVGAESGILAALALALAIALSLRFLRTRNPLVLGPMLGLAAFMVDAMTTNLYSIPSIAVTAWMIAPAVAPLFARAGSAPPEPAVAVIGDGARVEPVTGPSGAPTEPVTEPHAAPPATVTGTDGAPAGPVTDTHPTPPTPARPH
jgi:O-antigen ligase